MGNINSMSSTDLGTIKPFENKTSDEFTLEWINERVNTVLESITPIIEEQTKPFVTFDTVLEYVNPSFISYNDITRVKCNKLVLTPENNTLLMAFIEVQDSVKIMNLTTKVHYSKNGTSWVPSYVIWMSNTPYTYSKTELTITIGIDTAEFIGKPPMYDSVKFNTIN